MNTTHLLWHPDEGVEDIESLNTKDTYVGRWDDFGYGEQGLG